MARVIQRRKLRIETLPFKKTNYQIIGMGLLFIILGYIALSQSPWDGFLPLVVAPILLILGYCILIPLGILYRPKEEQQSETVTTGEKSA
jgi:hypothetical protein